MVPWAKGHSLLWDVACFDTLTPQNMHNSAAGAGSAAAEQPWRLTRERRQKTKVIAHECVPVVIEIMGAWEAQGAAFINDVNHQRLETPGRRRF